MRYTFREVVRYAEVAARLAVLVALQKLGVRTAAIDEFDDLTVLRAFDLALGFEPVQLVRYPAGWTCPHMTITSGHSLGKPTAWCGCDMAPLHPNEAV